VVESAKINPFEGLYEVYLLCFDDTRGHVPFFIYPDEKIRDDEEYMRPINIHTIWWMDMKDQAVTNHVDLEYGDKIYFARKFLTLSMKESGNNQQDIVSTEIIIMLALPIDITIFGGELLNMIAINIIKNFEGKLFHIIESEIANEEIIKTQKIKEKIKIGEILKQRLKEMIKTTCRSFFTSAVKTTDTKSINLQKAISYLSLRGIDFGKNGMTAKATNRALLTISQIIISVKSEIEVIVQNTSNKEFNDINIRMVALKNFVEKEVMTHLIDFWYPEEELLFISPMIPEIKEYYLFIKDEKWDLLSKKIDLEELMEN